MHNAALTAIIYEKDDLVENIHLEASGRPGQKLRISSPRQSERKATFRVRTTDSVTAVWGKTGAAFGAVCGLVLDNSVFNIPGISPGLLDGPLASWIAAVVQDALVFGIVSALCTGAIRAGISKVRMPKRWLNSRMP